MVKGKRTRKGKGNGISGSAWIEYVCGARSSLWPEKGIWRRGWGGIWVGMFGFPEANGLLKAPPSGALGTAMGSQWGPRGPRPQRDTYPGIPCLPFWYPPGVRPIYGLVIISLL